MMTGRENELAVEGWNYLDGLLDKVQAILRELRELKEERRRHRREKRAARKRAKRMRERKGGVCVWKS